MKEAEKEKNKATDIYEIGYLLSSGIASDAVLAEVAKIKSILEKHNCGFLSGAEPKLTELAYSISKAINGEKRAFDSAYFAWMKFKVAKDDIVGLKKDLDKFENILRYLFVNTVETDSLVSTAKKFSFTRPEKGKEIDETKIVKPLKIVKKKDEAEKPSKKIKDDSKSAEDADKADEQLDASIDKLII